MPVDTTCNGAGTHPPHVYDTRWRQEDFGPSREFRCAGPTVVDGKTGPTAAGVSARVSVPGSFARRLQDIESDTGYDTRRRALDGVRDGVSHTTVYETC